MNNDINIISYPKSGRTWLRALIGKYLVLKYNLPEKNMLETHLLTRAAGLPIVGFTHDGSEWTEEDPPKLLENIEYYKLSQNKSKYNNKKIILLSRNIKDIVVSAYFQATRREHVFNGDISSFIRDDRFGVKRIVTFYHIWYKNQNIPKGFIKITYENIHSNPKQALSNVLKFIGEKGLSQDAIELSIEFCSFKNLKEAERTNKFNSFRLKAGSNNDPESFKVRRGKIGGYVDYLSKEDSEYIDSVKNTFKKPTSWIIND